MRSRKKLRLINLTGHDLTIVDDDGKRVLLQSFGRARVESKMGTELESVYEGVKVSILRVTEQGITGLPKPESDTWYIVSGIVASAAKRDDVVAPSRVKREEGGRVVECRALLIPVLMSETKNEIIGGLDRSVSDEGMEDEESDTS